MKSILVLCLTALLLSACGGLWGTPLLRSNPTPAQNANAGNINPTKTPFQPEGFTPPPTAQASPIPGQPTNTPVSLSLWIAPAVPASLRQALGSAGIPLVDTEEKANLRVEAGQAASGNARLTTWIYCVVTPFPTITDEVSLAELQNAWNGAASGAFAGRPLWMDEPTLAAFTSLWGTPAPGAVSTAPAETLVDSAWANPPAWGIVPFEALEPRWKVLRVDGQSPLHNDFNPETYPLKIQFTLATALAGPPGLDELLPATNRDGSKLTVLAMTGVTALVRATADKMEAKGILYPGEAVRDVLRAADLTHISNEIPFDPQCPKPDPWTDSLVFCSDPKYMALLQDVGTDIVELTGNHMLDHGASNFLYTLDLYDQNNLKYFAGGRDLAASEQALKVTDHGNKLAFLGCNYAGPPSDFAGESNPGSAPCDFEEMHAQIADLRAQGYLPIVTFQYNEYYVPYATEYEMRDFRSMAEAGAVIVSGSQAHVPAAMEFDGEAFIHYGLGNLFFDQMSHLMPDGSTIYDTRNLFIDRHVFYNGKYIGTELLPHVIEDYARPRPMTEAERIPFLETIFGASGW